jgi:mannitol/fructose-specific phosphotransferase system IIA component (Ntr-type)
MPKLSACIQEGRVILHLQAQKKMEAIRELAMRLEGPEEITDVKRFLSLVMQREKVETTAVGHGVAIPHAHGDCVKSLVIGVGVSPQGIDFAAMDGEPVRIMVMIASPIRHFQDYLKAVSRVARLLNQADCRQRLLDARSIAEVIEVFRQVNRL